jgi:hypothetical protein
MKRLSLLLIGLLISSTVCFSAENELRFLPTYIFPGDDHTWDEAYGIDVQYILWHTPNLGTALSAGVSSWKINSIYVGYGTVTEVDGSARTFPIGASVLYRPTVGGPSEVTLECGLRYVFVNSDINVTVSDRYGIYKHKVDIDDGLVGLLGADISFPVSSTIKVGFGAGYQFDISKGDVIFQGIDIGNNEMKGFFLRLGMNIKI